MTSQPNPALPLQGKVAIVTGASRGIGAGLAMELARRGAKVGLVGSSHHNNGLCINRSRSSTRLPTAKS